MSIHSDYFDRLRASGAEAPRRLQAGATAQAFTTLEGFLEVTLPLPLRKLWTDHDGSNVAGALPAMSYFDGVQALYSIGEAAQDYASLQEDEGESGDVPAGFLPLGRSADGNRLMVNCRSGSPSYGAVYDWSSEAGMRRMCESLDRYFETLVAWLEAGALSVDAQGGLSRNGAQANTIAKPLNPGCEMFDATLPSVQESPDWV